MAKQALGGVVDHDLRVYGTSNLRIADASIIPMAIGAHLQATTYAIGERVSSFKFCYALVLSDPSLEGCAVHQIRAMIVVQQFARPCWTAV